MLFGILRDGKESFVVRIPVSNDIGKNLGDDFRTQSEDFFSDGTGEYEIKDFYPGDPTTDEVIFRMEFDDAVGMRNAIASPEGVPLCDLDRELPNLTAIFMEHPDVEGRILIQVVEKRRILLPQCGWLIFKKFQEEGVKPAVSMMASSNSKGTLVDAEDCGLKIDDKISAVFENGELLFKSYYQANKIFDLGDLLLEATDDVVRAFLSLDSIGAEDDVAEILGTLGKSQRKKVAKVMALGFVEKFSATEIANRAKNAKLNMEIVVKNGKISFPGSSRERTILLQFLANGIMKSYLDDDNDYEVGAMRPHK